MREIVVSLTSHPARIKHVSRAVGSIMLQTKKPDRVILWLSEQEFPNREDDLPDILLKLKIFGLQIEWVAEDLKPHKKYYYAMQQFTNSVIITIDDDIYYSPVLIEKLYNSYEKHPEAISCGVVNRMTFDRDGTLLPYSKWIHNDTRLPDVPLMDTLPVGMGGILYPPGIMPQWVFDQEVISQTCLYNDDLWLKASELMLKVPVVLVSEIPYPKVIDEVQKFGLYRTVNNRNGNDLAWNRIEAMLSKRMGVSFVLLNNIHHSKMTLEDILYEKRPDLKYDAILLKKLEQGFVIYGAGNYAMIAIECLREINRNLIPNAIVVSESPREFEKWGIPVREVMSYKKQIKDMIVIVAVSEKDQYEIKEKLREIKPREVFYVKNYIMSKLLHANRDLENYQEIFSWSLMEEGKYIG